MASTTLPDGTFAEPGVAVYRAIGGVLHRHTIDQVVTTGDDHPAIICGGRVYLAGLFHGTADAAIVDAGKRLFAEIQQIGKERSALAELLCKTLHAAEAFEKAEENRR